MGDAAFCAWGKHLLQLPLMEGHSLGRVSTTPGGGGGLVVLKLQWIEDLLERTLDMGSPGLHPQMS